jgi:type II secretory pathway pseudopilin PulG
MKIRLRHGAARLGGSRAGLTLIECLAYIGVLGVLMSVGSFTVVKSWNQSRDLRRASQDIQRALNVGQHWREDLRAASGPIEAQSSPAGELVRIPKAGGMVTYQFSGTEIRRHTGEKAAPVLILEHVKSSQMRPLQRGRVAAWCWELELQPAQKQARTRPLFTFLAVPGKEAAR